MRILNAEKVKQLIHGSRTEKGFWSLADQGVVSLGSFLTNILLARVLHSYQYGTYAILLGILLVIYGTHGAIVTYPLLLLGASESQDALRSLTVFSLWLTTGIGLLLGTAVVIGCWAFANPSLGIWAAVAIFFWIIQETVRRGLMAHMRFRDAICGDAVSYLGQTVVVLVLARLGRLSIESAFGAMAATSVIAAGLQSAQLDIRSLRLHEARASLRRFWNLGRWMVLSNFTGMFSLQFFPWALAMFRGAPMAGVFQALSNVIGVTNPVLNSTVNLIIPASAGAWRASGSRAASRVASHYGFLAALMLAPYFVLIFLFPEKVLALFYGHASGYIGYGIVLRVLVIAATVNCFAVLLGSFVSALEQTRMAFLALASSAIISVVLGVPLIRLVGILGAAAAILASTFVRTGVLFTAVLGKDFDVELRSTHRQELLREVLDRSRSI